MTKRFLTGVQSTGIPHLGNILGAIKPAIELSNQDLEPSFFFIANFHSLTTIRDPKLLAENTRATAAAWMAFGFDTKANVFYRQSDIPQVAELTWYLSCFTPYPMLANAHSFKDKANRLSDVNAGLFTYPVLMAADILLYDAHVVPVGKDQKQHLEMTRDIASTMNHLYGEDTFVLPEAKIDESVMVIPGTDGQKMSKSYNNFINIFDGEKKLKKTVMSIKTDSLPLDAPKNPDNCNVFALYKLVASPAEAEELHNKYTAGGMGYGDAKKKLLAILLEKYKNQRATFNTLINDPAHIENELKLGAEKAKAIADKTLERVRIRLGY